MPLKLSTPQTITHTIDTFQIIVFSYNFSTHTLSCGWREGTVDAQGNFQKVNERWVTLYGPDVAAVFQTASQSISTTADVAKAITQALQERFGAVGVMSVDLDTMEISVEVATGRWQVLSAADTQALIQRASQIAGGDVYVALKSALYQKIQQITGVTGTVI